MSHSFRHFRYATPFLVLALLGAGCSSGSSSKAAVTTGGVWKTTDAARTWTSKRALVNGSKVTATAGNFNITSIVMDPQDHLALYAATAGNGIMYSLDGGDSWQQPKNFSGGVVGGIAVDPKNKCVVYATAGNKVFKTDSCMRDWTQVFFDPRTTKSFTPVAVDWFNSSIIYAGSSDGDVLKSADGGATWQVVKRVPDAAVSSIVIDKADSRIVYVGTQSDGIWKTVDGGTTWEQIKKQFSGELSDARRVVQIVLDPKTPNRLYEISKYGIIRSDDGGATWVPLKLTTPPGSVRILSLVVDPTNPNHLVYTGANAFAVTTDGGQTWSMKKLPTTRAGSALIIDPQDPNIMYLGVMEQKS